MKDIFTSNLVLKSFHYLGSQSWIHNNIRSSPDGRSAEGLCHVNSARTIVPFGPTHLLESAREHFESRYEQSRPSQERPLNFNGLSWIIYFPRRPTYARELISSKGFTRCPPFREGGGYQSKRKRTHREYRSLARLRSGKHTNMVVCFSYSGGKRSMDESRWGYGLVLC